MSQNNVDGQGSKAKLVDNQQGGDKTKSNVDAAKRAYEEAKKQDKGRGGSK